MPINSVEFPPATTFPDPYHFHAKKNDIDGIETKMQVVMTCGNNMCGNVLSPPLKWCSKCKGEAYCGKECQVRDLPAEAPPAASSDTHTYVYTCPHRRLQRGRRGIRKRVGRL